MGRPGTGTKFPDVEKVAMVVASVAGVTFEPQNPLADLMSDPHTGRLRDDVLEVRSLPAIIELETADENLAAVLKQL